MKSSRTRALGALLALALMALPRAQTRGTPAPADANAERGAVDANTGFALDFYRKLAERGAQSNLFVSPYSVSTILSLTAEGARGATARQMQQTLHIADGASYNAGMSAVLRRLLEAGKGPPTSLSVANSLWLSPLYTLLPDFRAISEKAYAATTETADFPRRADSERSRINKWVEEKTESRITDLIPPGGVNRDTALVLVNAVYFKGAWQTPFRTQATRPEPFRVSSTQSVQAPLMQGSGSWSYLENDDVQVVSLPYAARSGAGRVSMLVVLPRRQDGLADVERRLTTSQLDAWVRGLRSQPGRVLLPKFKVTFGATLSAPLRALGMTDAFRRDAADFSGLVAAGPRVWIDEVFHKAFIDVDEIGTEAAAATAVVISPTAVGGGQPPVPFTFRADHPFLFAIRFDATGSILFMGRVANPAAP